MSKDPVHLISVAAMAEKDQGGRPYMEDYTAIEFEPNESGGQGFVAVFDGHGGKHASSFALNHLWANIKSQKDVQSKDTSKVMTAIRRAFRETQNGMWKAIASWPSNRPGVWSTAGTTVSACIFRRLNLYICHLGDSGIVLARSSKHGAQLVAHPLTVDHKPESEPEKARIESAGGEVRPGNGGVHRVVWNRVLQPHCGPILRSTKRESVPFLSVARSLGDLWSYNYEKGVHVVSPEPDISVRAIDLETDRFLVIASDGLWGVMTPQAAVDFVVAHRNESNDADKDDEDGANVCHLLVLEALDRWRARRQRADNISVILLFLHKPPSPGAAAKTATWANGTSLTTSGSTATADDVALSAASSASASRLPLKRKRKWASSSRRRKRKTAAAKRPRSLNGEVVSSSPSSDDGSP